MTTYDEVLYAFKSEGDGGIAMNSEHSKDALDAWLQSVKADAWDEGFNTCANWWEIHHHGVVRDERNPYREANG